MDAGVSNNLSIASGGDLELSKGKIAGANISLISGRDLTADNLQASTSSPSSTNKGSLDIIVGGSVSFNSANFKADDISVQAKRDITANNFVAESMSGGISLNSTSGGMDLSGSKLISTNGLNLTSRNDLIINNLKFSNLKGDVNLISTKGNLEMQKLVGTSNGSIAVSADQNLVADFAKLTSKSTSQDDAVTLSSGLNLSLNSANLTGSSVALNAGTGIQAKDSNIKSTEGQRDKYIK